MLPVRMQNDAHFLENCAVPSKVKHEPVLSHGALYIVHSTAVPHRASQQKYRKTY